MCYTIAVDNDFFEKEATDIFLKNLNENGFIFGSFSGKTHLFIKMFLDGEGSKEKAGGIIADFIFKTYVKRFFLRAVDDVYYYFDAGEKEEIFSLLDAKKEKEIISQKASKYLSDNDFIEIKGFCDFRLDDFLDGIFSMAEDMADEYLAKKEYLEFIKLLKHFLDIQNSECERVDVFRRKNGEYVLIDENKNQIPVSDCEFSVEIADEILDVYDILLSELINLAPKKIVIHNRNLFENSQVLTTIENIFENNVTYCDGCSMCSDFENDEKNDKQK